MTEAFKKKFCIGSYRLELWASHPYTSGLEIILQLAPIKLSWQTFFGLMLELNLF